MPRLAFEYRVLSSSSVVEHRQFVAPHAYAALCNDHVAAVDGLAILVAQLGVVRFNFNRLIAVGGQRMRRDGQREAMTRTLLGIFFVEFMPAPTQLNSSSRHLEYRAHLPRHAHTPSFIVASLSVSA
jgi:hypothetical protein